MNNALKVGNKAAALQFLNPNAVVKYSRVLDSLMPNMPTIVNSYLDLQRFQVGESIAEYTINRIINGMNSVFFVNFIQDANGVWRIDSM